MIVEPLLINCEQSNMYKLLSSRLIIILLVKFTLYRMVIQLCILQVTMAMTRLWNFSWGEKLM